MDTIQLSNGVMMPLASLGVFQGTDQQACKGSVLSTLDTGKPMILNIPSLNEAYRLHSIQFEQ